MKVADPSVIDYVDWSDPIDWSEPLNRGLVSRWMAVPNYHGWKTFTWRDLCRRNHGTLTNMTPASAWSGSSHRGGWGSLAFDGVNDYVDCGDTDALDGTPELTCSIWNHQTVGQAAANQAMLVKWNYATQGNFGLQSGITNPSNVRVYLATSLTDDGSGYGEETTDVPRVADKWQMITFTFSGSAGVKIYVDARLSTISRTGSPPSATTAGGSAPLRIGQFQGLGRFFLGGLADACIYNRALSAAEVAALYQNQLAFSPRTLRRWVRRAYSIPAVAPGGGLLLRRRRMAAA